MLTAEYGGTGDKQIEPGMVVEEPDIEIGAGVSSKGKYHFLILVHFQDTNSIHSDLKTYADRQRWPARTTLDPRWPQ